MKKGTVAILIAVVLMTSLCCGCGKNSRHDVYREIYKRYSNMDSFYAAATVTVRSDKTESHYSVRQFYQAPDSFALFVDAPEDVSGSGYILKNGSYKILSGFGSDAEFAAKSTNGKNVMFICDFFDEYFKSEETSVQTSGALSGNTTTLSCFLPPGSKQLYVQKLEIDSKTFLPLVLETSDINNNPVVTVEYTDFKRNCDIEKTIFD